MDYQNIVKKCEDSAYLISMVSVDELIRFGYSIGLNKSSKVLDLCCGYGTVLKIWSEAFGVTGVGVDHSDNFLSKGRERIVQAGVDKIDLILGDVTVYTDTKKYDVVICSETIGSIANTLALGEKFLKDRGILAYQKLYSKVQKPPQELVDFDNEVLPLSELYKEFKKLGYYITNMASDCDSSWEHYVLTWSGKRDIEELRKNPYDVKYNLKIEDWIDKWFLMYFDYRRQYEGQALFGLERL
jgi:cyclopropane fatty-acyl-phospholipid synthase-like methyltransferase